MSLRRDIHNTTVLNSSPVARCFQSCGLQPAQAPEMGIITRPFKYICSNKKKGNNIMSFSCAHEYTAEFTQGWTPVYEYTGGVNLPFIHLSPSLRAASYVWCFSKAGMVLLHASQSHSQDVQDLTRGPVTYSWAGDGTGCRLAGRQCVCPQQRTNPKHFSKAVLNSTPWICTLRLSKG